MIKLAMHCILKQRPESKVTNPGPSKRSTWWRKSTNTWLPDWFLIPLPCRGEGIAFCISWEIIFQIIISKDVNFFSFTKILCYLIKENLVKLFDSWLIWFKIYLKLQEYIFNFPQNFALKKKISDNIFRPSALFE